MMNRKSDTVPRSEGISFVGSLGTERVQTAVSRYLCKWVVFLCPRIPQNLRYLKCEYIYIYIYLCNASMPFNPLKVTIIMNSSFYTMKLFVYYILASLITYKSVNALQILAIEFIPARSHWNFMSAVLQSLSDNGHNVTVYTPFQAGNRSNYTEINLELPSMVGMDAMESLKMFAKPTDLITSVMNMTRHFCNIAHEQKDIRELLNSGKSNFDIIITETASSECSSYVASKINLPMIYLVPSPMLTHIEHSVFGDGPNPATVSHLVAYHAVPRTFAQRLSNFILLGTSLFALIYKEMELKKIDPQPYDLVKPKKPSLVFMNTHYITDA
ncbi:UDP-glucuronosyltransferase 2B17-like, partial [Aphis craccivora]